MLTFYYGTNQQKLADRLLATCREAPGGNPMTPEILVVRNHGIGQWLSLYTAEKEGVAANMEFEFPSERIWKLIRGVDPDIPDTLPSDREPMTWSLMKLLQDDKVLGQFDNLRHYIREDEPDRRSMRIWKLASKIADVFDQYLVYRPELILDWEEGKLQTGNTAEQWQSRLWNRLINYWKNDHNQKWLHRARLQRQLWNAIDEQRLNTAGLPERVSMFGVSGVSPAFVKTMIKLSKLTDVYFYQVSIDPQIKKSGDFQNPLLQSLGSESAHFMDRFSSFVKVDRNLANTMEWESVEAVHPGDNSILHAVQSDLLQDSPLKNQPPAIQSDLLQDSPLKNQPPAIQSDLLQDSPPGDRRSGAWAGDSSIQVHSCHSPMREVEVLYDQLLAILDEHPDINPDEILVMTPDIKTYAPIIEAVFDSPDAGQPEVPYSVADRGVVGRNPAVEAFLDILDLCESRMKVTDVMDLLDSNPVREAFAFSDEQVNRLNRWIRDNRIRWGVDGRFKQKVNVPESDRFTWRSGLDRVLLGYAMKPEDDRLFHNIFPYDEIETSEDAELGGKFARFLQALFEISRSVDDVKSPAGWGSVLHRIPGMFLPGTKDYFREISRIRDAIAQLAENASQGGFHTPIPFAIVRSWLRDRLDEQATGGGRIGRGVTFSSLMPMRNIPFRVIGMIGMNEGVFPRSKIPIEFDLMHLETQPGDPVRSDEDRHLFLENLLSARSHLYVSYVGQSNRQDAHFPPSVVLQELLDYLEVYYDLRTDQMVTRHRLQAFSPRYFKNGDELFSYSKTKQKISQQLLEEDHGLPAFVRDRLPEPGDEWKSLSVRELVAFFQHPSKYLLQNRLGIYPGEEDVLTADREPFVLSRLDSYQVGQELLDRFLHKKPLEPFYQNLKARNMLPEGWSGEQAYRQKVTEVREFGSHILPLIDQEPLPDKEVRLNVNGYRIAGTLTDIYEDALMTYRFGKARPKDKIDWWIRHLLFQYVKPRGHSGMSVLYSWKKDSFEIHRLSPVEDAERKLSELMGWYWQGLQSPLCLYCESSYAYAKSVLADGEQDERGITRAAGKWKPGWNGYPGEGDDAYHKLVTAGKQPFSDPAFPEFARSFWSPFFKALNRSLKNVD